jgi:type II secretory pathway pseudopilin PulG
MSRAGQQVLHQMGAHTLSGKVLSGYATRRRSQGFAYLWVLLLVALMGLGLSVAGEVWSTLAKREREKELIFVGRQFQLAIQRYYAFRPAGTKDMKVFPRAASTLCEKLVLTPPCLKKLPSRTDAS